MLTEHLLNASRRSPRIKTARRGFPGGAVVYLPMQETPVPVLAQEGSTCRGATEPVRHSYWACAPELGTCDNWAHVLQLQKPTRPRACALQPEKPPQWEAGIQGLESNPYSPQLEKSPGLIEDSAQPKLKE